MPIEQNRWADEESIEDMEAAEEFYDRFFGPPAPAEPVAGSLDLLVFARQLIGSYPFSSDPLTLGRYESGRKAWTSASFEANFEQGEDRVVCLTLPGALFAAAIRLALYHTGRRETVERASRALFSVLKSKGQEERACTYAGEIVIWQKENPTFEEVLALLDETIRLNQ